MLCMGRDVRIWRSIVVYLRFRGYLSLFWELTGIRYTTHFSDLFWFRNNYILLILITYVCMYVRMYVCAKWRDIPHEKIQNDGRKLFTCHVFGISQFVIFCQTLACLSFCFTNCKIYGCAGCIMLDRDLLILSSTTTWIGQDNEKEWRIYTVCMDDDDKMFD